jgi:hypothetical protein
MLWRCKMTQAIATEYDEGPISVIGGKLVIRNYEDDEPAVVHHFERLSGHTRPEELHRLLVLGTYAADAVPGALTFRDVAEDADRAKTEMQRMVDVAKRSAEDAIQQQADVMKRSLTDELAKYCSPDRSTSIPANVEAKMKGIVDAAKEAMKGQLDSALNITNDEAPLAQIFSKLNDVSGQLQAMVARHDERRSSAFRKGDDFQQAVFEEIARIAEVHGDSPEFTANIEGEAGTKAGDVTVVVNGGFTGGREVRLVFEAMDREARGNAKARLESVLLELEEATRNRVAAAAIAVASNAAMPATGGQRLRRPTDGRFVVLYEKGHWDPVALEVAYCIAKIEALRSLNASPGQAADLVRAGQVVSRLLGKVDEFGRLQSNLRDGQGAFLKSMDIAERLKSELYADLALLQSLLTGPGTFGDQTAA